MIRQVKIVWRSLPLPWRPNRLVGSDPRGEFLFFEGPPVHSGSLSRTRRVVEYMNGRQEEYTADQIPVQWMAWLRHTRTDPPSHQVLAADAQRERIQILARQIEAKDAVEAARYKISQDREIAEAKAALKLQSHSPSAGTSKSDQSKSPVGDSPEAWSPVAKSRL
ncbi:hypothetical protein BC830DRAFT_518998 [Chytriomyces sp. MP71]|nr:hypothetical protein BC830DRAFT_518998 [Chytriomyces sp. MP71]